MPPAKAPGGVLHGCKSSNHPVQVTKSKNDISRLSMMIMIPTVDEIY